MDERILKESEDGYSKKIKSLAIFYLVMSMLMLLMTPTVERGHKSHFITLLYCCGSILFVLAVAFFIRFLATKSMQMIITDKRVYGKALWGKRVDLPLDSVSAVGTRMFGGIVVATSSGRINFDGLSNRDELHNCMSELLVKRNRNTVDDNLQKSKGVAELKKLKELLDMDIITQEEFEAKKKQILGL